MILDLTKIDNIQMGDVNLSDYPEFSDAFIESADYNGVEMTQAQLDFLNDNHQEFVYDNAYQSIY